MPILMNNEEAAKAIDNMLPFSVLYDRSKSWLDTIPLARLTTWCEKQFGSDMLVPVEDWYEANNEMLDNEILDSINHNWQENIYVYNPNGIWTYFHNPRDLKFYFKSQEMAIQFKLVNF